MRAYAIELTIKLIIKGLFWCQNREFNEAKRSLWKS